ncbi:hypothetical protein ES705_11129 [subsurface metagenome]
MMIKKFIIRIYRVVADFFLNFSGCKLTWRDKEIRKKDIEDKIVGDYFLR